MLPCFEHAPRQDTSKTQRKERNLTARGSHWRSPSAKLFGTIVSTRGDSPGMLTRVDVDALRRKLEAASASETIGKVVSAGGLCVHAQLPGARLADLVTIESPDGPIPAEIVGFEGARCLLMPLRDVGAIGPDDPIRSTGTPLTIGVGETLLGRVLDGLGQPLLGGEIAARETRRVDARPPPALERPRIETPLATGIRAIDGLLTLGEGQRIGLFSGAGVGKSTLLGSIARNADVDVVVVALVGERSREVRQFVDECLGEAGMQRSVVVAATSDAHAVERVRAAQVATTIAEHFRDSGKRVLLVLDSLTRVARAQREIGLARGEPPGRRGFPPSVFGILPRLAERAGQSRAGSITGIYTVLVESDDLDEPVADEVRGLMDGHIVLDRRLAERGHFPAVDVVASVSRVMGRVTSREHQHAARQVKAWLAHLEQKRDLVMLGAYKEGLDPMLDLALSIEGELRALLVQDATTPSPLDATLSRLEALHERATG